MYGDRQGSNSFFPCGYSGVPIPFFGNTVLSPLDGLGTLVENHLAINVRIYFCQGLFLNK